MCRKAYVKCQGENGESKLAGARSRGGRVSGNSEKGGVGRENTVERVRLFKQVSQWTKRVVHDEKTELPYR